MSRLFITGGSGYVGRNLIRHFVARGDTVIALARSEQAAATVAQLGAVPYHGDLLDAGLSTAMQGCDMLIHAAADTNHGWGSEAQRLSNLDGTRHVFASARHAGIAQAVHISTESVLLDGQPLVNATEEHPFPARPAGAYSRTKGEAERIALSFATAAMRVMALRPRFVWGRDDSTALPQLLAAARAGKLAWIDGGGYRTSTTHIANLCAGVELALQRGRSGEVYFITDDQPQLFREFITQLLATQGVVAPDKSVPRALLRKIAAVGDLLANLSQGRIKPPISRQEFATMAVEVTLDIGKARRELGYEPVMSTEAGLAELRAAA
ncbi:NAD-dependent epimerase/dehydratase family protein [Duganella sp. FT80W]|uniref:NAD-dependent epimerase/dehydratase family protein n=1 Tax=Duganella guangzhouensis TaxID=2666084 RepID=A0A6I2L5P4_9BURK|nr:NAD-dependent epimerase/dehydratase family protein [Duganella guangzhouensis]MRW91609.1 NAD-dependent epimerase/dehydratase family protein [Duganella guangzhouensis]